ncbi:hypothetical protein V6Z11_D02G142400 [Gossypium hirsutum]
MDTDIFPTPVQYASSLTILTHHMEYETHIQPYTPLSVVKTLTEYLQLCCQYNGEVLPLIETSFPHYIAHPRNRYNQSRILTYYSFTCMTYHKQITHITFLGFTYHMASKKKNTYR